MSKEKLTVEKTVHQIQSKVFINKAEDYNPNKHGKEKLINLLKQIRDEVCEEVCDVTDDGTGLITVSGVKFIFNKYLNEKGGK
jgi:hypothetical protein